MEADSPNIIANGFISCAAPRQNAARKTLNGLAEAHSGRYLARSQDVPFKRCPDPWNRLRRIRRHLRRRPRIGPVPMGVGGDGRTDP